MGGHHARSSLACLMSSKSIWSVVSRRSIVKVGIETDRRLLEVGKGLSPGG